MDLKEKLLLHRLKKKYESQSGIKSFKIATFEELTKNERDVLDDINTVGSPCTDKLSLSEDYSKQVYWIKQKARPYLSFDSEIIIFDSGYLIVLLLKDIEAFLQQYLEDKMHTLNIGILNRDLKKCIKTFLGEYDLEFFERDI